MGEVGAPPPYISVEAAIVEKLWLWDNGVLNFVGKRPFPCKIYIFGEG